MPRRRAGTGLIGEFTRVDRAVYRAVAATPTPHLDKGMRRLSRAADHSKLSLAASIVLALAGGVRGRQAARAGLASVAVTSGVVNLIIKPVGRRRRPDPARRGVPTARRIRTPRSSSFPSGHTASAVAFASAVGQILPGAGIPLHGLAGLVGYSRVHTGVHYPGDVIAGAVIGSITADVTALVLERPGANRTSAYSSASSS